MAHIALPPLRTEPATAAIMSVQAPPRTLAATATSASTLAGSPVPDAAAAASSAAISGGVAPPHTIAQANAPPAPADNQQLEAVLTKILELEEIDINMYRGVSPQVPRWGRIYGGQTVAQALVASCRTVEPRFIVHSLHSYFLRPGNDDIPIIYYVERLRNGKSFASRRVTALQKGQAIFAMNVSFMTSEVGVEHQDVMPVVPGPESLKSLMDTYRDVLGDARVSPRVKKGLQRSLSLPFPVDLRRCLPATLEQRLKVNEPIQRSWIRAQGQLGNSLMLHQCALAYMSDWSLLETTLLPHALHGWIQKDEDQSLQMASIDHSMWFHHAFRADEWLLYDMQSPAASGGRGLAFGRFFTRDGKLIVTTAQEGLIRVRSSKADAAAAAAKKQALAAAAAAAATAAGAGAAAATTGKPDKMLITKRWTSAGPSADFTQAPPRTDASANVQLPSKL